eukprot:scaffold408_cov388-Prasinococcus_capsulatus_cf.AAC.13
MEEVCIRDPYQFLEAPCYRPAFGRGSSCVSRYIIRVPIGTERGSLQPCNAGVEILLGHEDTDPHKENGHEHRDQKQRPNLHTHET